MDDLISRRAAIDELEYAAWGKEWDKALAKAMLESLPSAQPEIIRCKDCGKQPVCRFSQFQGNDGYCGLAERKGER